MNQLINLLGLSTNLIDQHCFMAQSTLTNLELAVKHNGEVHAFYDHFWSVLEQLNEEDTPVLMELLTEYRTAVSEVHKKFWSKANALPEHIKEKLNTELEAAEEMTNLHRLECFKLRGENIKNSN